MKHPILCILTVMAAVGATSRPARDQPPVYTCTRASQPPAIDGVLDDPAWGWAAWTEDFIDIEGTAKPLPPLRTRAKLAWDDQHLYMAAELVEPHVAATIRDRDAQLYREQAFEVFIDPGADGTNYLELQINPLNTVCDLVMDKPYRDRGRANVDLNIDGLLTAVRVSGTINDHSDVDGGWCAEIAIPWAALKSFRDDAAAAPSMAPTDGERWRFNFARMRRADDAPKGGAKPQRNHWVWAAQGSVNMHLPERWGWVQFRSSSKP